MVVEVPQKEAHVVTRAHHKATASKPQAVLVQPKVPREVLSFLLHLFKRSGGVWSFVFQHAHEV